MLLFVIRRRHTPAFIRQLLSLFAFASCFSLMLLPSSHALFRLSLYFFAAFEAACRQRMLALRAAARVAAATRHDGRCYCRL